MLVTFGTHAFMYYKLSNLIYKYCRALFKLCCSLSTEKGKLKSVRKQTAVADWLVVLW